MDIIFERFNYKEGLNEQREMFQLCFPETIGKPEENKGHYFWKFQSFPGTPKSFEYVAYENNKMLGYYAALPYKYRIGDEIVTAGMVCDVMTHPEARGKGVFAKIGKFATDDMKNQNLSFTTGYPIRPEVIPGHLKVGWEKPFKLPMYLKPLRSNDILKSKGMKSVIPIVNFTIEMYNKVLNIINPIDKHFEIKTLNVDELLNHPGIVVFLQEWSKGQKNHLIKDNSFLKWRLGAHSDEYKNVIVLANNRVVGIAILRQVELHGIKSLAIVDLMTLFEIKNATTSLLRSISDYAKGLNCEVIVTMISRPWAKKYKLFKHGFVKSPYSFTFIIKILNFNKNKTELLDERNWHLTWIDSDDL